MHGTDIPLVITRSPLFERTERRRPAVVILIVSSWGGRSGRRAGKRLAADSGHDHNRLEPYKNCYGWVVLFSRVLALYHYHPLFLSELGALFLRTSPVWMLSPLRNARRLVFHRSATPSLPHHPQPMIPSLVVCFWFACFDYKMKKTHYKRRKYQVHQENHAATDALTATEAY